VKKDTMVNHDMVVVGVGVVSYMAHMLGTKANIDHGKNNTRLPMVHRRRRPGVKVQTCASS